MQALFIRPAVFRIAVFTLATIFSSASGAEENTSEHARQAFARVDGNTDGRISHEELRKALAPERGKDANRQFKMFDRDADGGLSLEEFRNVPALSADKDRGPLADPLGELAAAAFESIEKRWSDWDDNGDGSLAPSEFDFAELIGSVSGLDRSRFADWDRDADGLLGRDECRLSLEVAFGVRRPQGDLLRLADGRSVSWLGFKHIDRDGDDALSLEELKLHGFDGDRTEVVFKKSDVDADGKISFAEWAAEPNRSIGATWQFLWLDRDFDALLDAEELSRNPLAWQFPLVRHILPAFDGDGDGQLSFHEFLATPLVCLQHKWHLRRTDENHNGRLEFAEFRELTGSSRLDAAALEAIYFQRFDRDQSGALDCAEFFFDSDAVAPEERIKSWDSDHDGWLSEAEFVSRAGLDAATAKRDFGLFDLNGDGRMGASELASVPSINGPLSGGRMPDPLQSLVERCAFIIEKNRSEWDADRNGTLNSTEFLEGLSQTFGVPLAAGVVRADANDDGVISADEARRATQMLAGFFSASGETLREPDGRVCDLLKFRELDRDHDGAVERLELQGLFSGAYPNLIRGFEAADANRDDQLSLDEWRKLPALGTVNPVNEFRHLDANLDGRLEQTELLARAPDWKRKVAEHMFPGFDLDEDGALSLSEYLFTPLANPLLKWYEIHADLDGDERLSLAEFLDEDGQFPLLAWQYFQCLDVDSSGRLEPDEYFFKIIRPGALYSLNFDGTGWHELFRLPPGRRPGSPAVSPDGKAIAFDVWPVDRNNRSTGPQKLFSVNIDGTAPRELCHGLMPSWSPDGRSLACSRNAPSRGSWIMTADGEERKFLDASWGAQWSPDGKQIVFYRGAEINLYDVATGAIRLLLGGANNRYQQVTWNMAWSPDSKQICFKGIRPNGAEEIAILAVDDAQPRLRVRFAGKDLGNDFAWHPSQDRIVFGRRDAGQARMQLYELNPKTADAPTLVPGQDPERTNSDACWTPDGKRLIIASGGF